MPVIQLAQAKLISYNRQTRADCWQIWHDWIWAARYGPSQHATDTGKKFQFAITGSLEHQFASYGKRSKISEI
jgi:hypothetical protein